MTITSPKTRVNLPASKLFEWSGNCQNFAHFLGDQAKDVNATEDTCSFTVENIAKINLKLLEKTQNKVRFVAENDKNIPLFIDFNYTATFENETEIEAVLDIDIPIFLKPLAEN